MDLTTTDKEMNVQALLLLVHVQVQVLANHVVEEDNVHLILLEDGIDVQVQVQVLVNHVEEEDNAHLIVLILIEGLEGIVGH